METGTAYTIRTTKGIKLITELKEHDEVILDNGQIAVVGRIHKDQQAQSLVNESKETYAEY